MAGAVRYAARFVLQPKFSNFLRIPYLQEAAGNLSSIRCLSDRPPLPKPPALAFSLYLKENMSRVKAEHEGSSSNLFSIMAREWKEMDEESKEPYIQMRERKMEEYEEALQEYEMTYGKHSVIRQKQLEKNERKEKRMQKKEQQQKRELKQEMEHAGKPKRPPSPFIMYALASNIRVVTAMDSWTKLSEDEKQVYQDKYQQLFAEYRIALESWQRKMLETGREDLLPKTVLTRLKKAIKKEQEM